MFLNHKTFIYVERASDGTTRYHYVYHAVINLFVGHVYGSVVFIISLNPIFVTTTYQLPLLFVRRKHTERVLYIMAVSLCPATENG